MKTLVGLAIVAVVSGLIGLVVCVFFLFRRFYWAALTCAVIFFGGPITLAVVTFIKDTQEYNEFEAARKLVHELCAKHGGDRIYRTVENVEGVFQLRARNPEEVEQWKDQYGMFDPWGAAQGDYDYPAISVGPGSDGYWYVEQQLGLGHSGPPYRRRTFAKSDKQANSDREVLKLIVVTVQRLRSRYGYVTEDLTTADLRKHWIAGGRIKIVDLQTKEVLAERVGYYLTDSRDWRVGAAYQNERICPHDSRLGRFLTQVLKPVQVRPTPEQIASLGKD